MKNPLKGSNFLPKHLTTTHLIGIMLILFLVTLGSLILFIDKDPIVDDHDKKISLIIIKGLVDVLLVSIIGGTVLALFKAYERYIEYIKIQTQIKLDFIVGIGKLYRLSKSIRRKLKSEGIKPKEDLLNLELTKEQYTFYATQMDELNDVQLEIEGFKIAAEKDFLFPGSKAIAAHLMRMEVYLNKILGEFEDKNSTIKKSERIDMNSFDFLKEFTSSAKNETLSEKFIISNKLKNYEPLSPEDETHYCFKNIFSNSYGKLLADLKL